MKVAIKKFFATMTIICLWSLSTNLQTAEMKQSPFWSNILPISTAHAQQGDGISVCTPDVVKPETGVDQFQEDIDKYTELAEDEELDAGLEAERKEHEMKNTLNNNTTWNDCRANVEGFESISEAYGAADFMMRMIPIGIFVAGVTFVALCVYRPSAWLYFAGGIAAILWEEIARSNYNNTLEKKKEDMKRAMTTVSGSNVSQSHRDVQMMSLDHTIDIYTEAEEFVQQRIDQATAMSIALGIAGAVALLVTIAEIAASLGTKSGTAGSCYGSNIPDFLNVPKKIDLWDAKTYQEVADINTNNIHKFLRNSFDESKNQILATLPDVDYLETIEYNVEKSAKGVDRYFNTKEYNAFVSKETFQSPSIDDYENLKLKLEVDQTFSQAQERLAKAQMFSNSRDGLFKYLRITSDMVFSPVFAGDDPPDVDDVKDTDAQKSSAKYKDDLDGTMSNVFGIAQFALAIAVPFVVGVISSSASGLIHGIARSALFFVYMGLEIYAASELGTIKGKITERKAEYQKLKGTLAQVVGTEGIESEAPPGADAPEMPDGEMPDADGGVSSTATDNGNSCAVDVSNRVGGVGAGPCNADVPRRQLLTDAQTETINGIDFPWDSSVTEAWTGAHNDIDEKGMNTGDFNGKVAGLKGAVSDGIRKMLKAYEKKAEEKGMPPMSHLMNEARKGMGMKIKKELDAVPKSAFANLPSFGASLGLDDEKEKDPNDIFSDMLAKKKGGGSEGGGKGKGKGGNQDWGDLFGTGSQKSGFGRSSLDSAKALSNYDLKKHDIVKDDGRNIFDVITMRYKRSAYRRLFKKKKKTKKTSKKKK